MQFVLNLNLTVDNSLQHDIKNPNDFVLNGIDFSSESKALLCLIDYCQLISNQEFKCNCLYSKQDFIRYSDFIEKIDLNDLLKKKYHDLNINFSELSAYGDTEITDTNLPSLKRNVNTECTITITGLTSLFRDIVKIGHRLRPDLNLIDLLGWRQNCVKACSEASKWTYLCEVVCINAYETLNETNEKEVLDNLFKKILECRLSARSPLSLHNQNKKTGLTKTNPRYLEDYHILISDLIVFYYLTLILNKASDFCRDELETKYSLVCEWYNNMKLDGNVCKYFLKSIKPVDDFKINSNQNESKGNSNLKSKDIISQEEVLEENDINKLIETLQMNIKSQFDEEIPLKTDTKYIYDYETINFKWSDYDDQINPSSGGLPHKRIERKCQQLENFLYIFKSQIYSKYKNNKENKQYALTLVDFCSGGGHLGILLAYMYPDCLVKLVENKEESLNVAIERIIKLNLKNCLLYKGNLNNFIGKFNVGMAIHACGSSTDLLIEKCIQTHADILISPCCYGSIKENDLIKYPRSTPFKQMLQDSNMNNYFKLTSYADKTEVNIAYEKTAYFCMSIVDSDRLLYLKLDNKYSYVQLTKLKPENCTTKNNVLLALNKL